MSPAGFSFHSFSAAERNQTWWLAASLILRQTSADSSAFSSTHVWFQSKVNRLTSKAAVWIRATSFPIQASSTGKQRFAGQHQHQQPRFHLEAVNESSSRQRSSEACLGLWRPQLVLKLITSFWKSNLNLSTTITIITIKKKHRECWTHSFSGVPFSFGGGLLKNINKHPGYWGSSGHQLDHSLFFLLRFFLSLKGGSGQRLEPAQCPRGKLIMHPSVNDWGQTKSWLVDRKYRTKYH